MSCFIHKNKEGVAVCTKCGKNMCEDCVALAGSICPTCYKPYMESCLALEEQKLEENEYNFSNIKSKITTWAIFAVLLVWTIVLPLVCLGKIYIIIRHEKPELEQKIKEGKIQIKKMKRILEKVDVALQQGSVDRI